MPRNVRNFWIEGETDSGTSFATGPRAKDEGFTARIFMRHEGQVVGPVHIAGQVTRDGEIVLSIERRMTGTAGVYISATDVNGDLRFTTRR